MSKPQFEIKDKEVFRDGEKIGFFTDPDNHYQSTHGNAKHRDEFLAWQEKQKPEEPRISPTVQAENSPIPIPPHEMIDSPKSAEVIPADRELPPVPKKAPPIRPGIGINSPDYLWWAWHESDAFFRSIYGKTKSEFEEEHGGYLEKIRNGQVKLSTSKP